MSNISTSSTAAAPVQPFLESFELNGPYINEAVFGVYHGSDAQWAALVDGLIDVGNAPLSLDERSDIEFNEWEVDQFWGIACSTHFDPFFIEEIVKSLLEEGILKRSSQGWIFEFDEAFQSATLELGQTYAQLPIPVSIQDVVNKRLERLSSQDLKILAGNETVHQALEDFTIAWRQMGPQAE